MDRKAFQAWLSGADALTEAQKVEAGEILAGRPVGAASLAAIERKRGKTPGAQAAAERILTRSGR